MNLLLDDSLIAFREEVRSFLRDNLTQDMRQAQRLSTGMYPEPEITRQWQRALNRRGWLVPLWPPEWGGTGWTSIERFIFEAECARAGAPVIHPMGVRLVGPVILRYGTPEQKRRFLPGIRDGSTYWCQGFSEPGAGSDLAALKTRAMRDGDDYIVNGSKIWTTHAHHADWMFALVRTSSEGRPQQGISFVLIDMKSPGVSVRPIQTMGGDHEVNEVFFDNVRVPQAHRIGAENAGWDCAKYLLQFERGAGITSPRLRSQLARVADALALLDAAGFGAPADLAPRFGEVLADLDAFEMLELRTLGQLAPGQAPGPAASLLKLRSSRLKQAIAELGADVLGVEALRWGDPGAPFEDGVVGALMPDYFNSRAVTIFGGAAEVQLSLIAQAVLPA